MVRGRWVRGRDRGARAPEIASQQRDREEEARQLMSAENRGKCGAVAAWAILALGGCLLLGLRPSAGDPPPPPPGPGGPLAEHAPPPDPDPDAAWFAAGDDPSSLAADDPLRIWWQGVRDFRKRRETLGGLYARQANLLERLGRRGPSPGGRKVTLPGIQARRRARAVISQLHSNQASIDKTEKALQEIAKRIAPHAAETRRRLTELREEILQRAKHADDDERTQPERVRAAWQEERLSEAIAVLEEVENDPARAEEKILKGLERLASAPGDSPGGSPPRFLAERLREQIEALRREQRFLRQRLEANEEALEELGERVERAMMMRQRRRGRSGQSGPGEGEPADLPPPGPGGPPGRAP